MKLRNRTSYNLFLRTWALLLAVVFTTTTVAWSAPFLGRLPHAASEVHHLASTSYFPLDLPEDLGTIEEAYGWGTDPSFLSRAAFPHAFIIIQDAHGNLSAQEHIRRSVAHILGVLPEEPVVLLEGAVGRVDTSPVSGIADKQMRDEIAERLFRKGYIDGVEWLGATDEPDLTLLGIEDPLPYRRNLEAALRIASRQEKASARVKAIREALESLTDYVCSKPLAALVRHVLAKDRASANTPDRIKRLLEEADAQHISMDAYSELTHLRRLLSQDGADALPRETDGAKLLSELDSLEGVLLRALATSYEERRFVRLYRHIHLLDRAINLNLVRAEADYLIRYAREFGEAAFIDYLKEKERKIAPEYAGQSDALMPSVIQFYRSARERDRVFVKNIERRIEKEKRRFGIVITGGFHTAGITGALRKNGVPYAVITPRIDKEVDLHLYRQNLMNLARAERSTMSLPRWWDNSLGSVLPPALERALSAPREEMLYLAGADEISMGFGKEERADEPLIILPPYLQDWIENIKAATDDMELAVMFGDDPEGMSAAGEALKRLGDAFSPAAFKQVTESNLVPFFTDLHAFLPDVLHGKEAYEETATYIKKVEEVLDQLLADRVFERLADYYARPGKNRRTDEKRKEEAALERLQQSAEKWSAWIKLKWYDYYFALAERDLNDYLTARDILFVHPDIPEIIKSIAQKGELSDEDYAKVEPLLQARGLSKGDFEDLAAHKESQEMEDVDAYIFIILQGAYTFLRLAEAQLDRATRFIPEPQDRRKALGQLYYEWSTHRRQEGERDEAAQAQIDEARTSGRENFARAMGEGNAFPAQVWMDQVDTYLTEGQINQAVEAMQLLIHYASFRKMTGGGSSVTGWYRDTSYGPKVILRFLLLHLNRLQNHFGVLMDEAIEHSRRDSSMTRHDILLHRAAREHVRSLDGEPAAAYMKDEVGAWADHVRRSAREEEMNRLIPILGAQAEPYIENILDAEEAMYNPESELHREVERILSFLRYLEGIREELKEGYQAALDRANGHGRAAGYRTVYDIVDRLFPAKDLLSRNRPPRDHGIIVLAVIYWSGILYWGSDDPKAGGRTQNVHRALGHIINEGFLFREEPSGPRKGFRLQVVSFDELRNRIKTDRFFQKTLNLNEKEMALLENLLETALRPQAHTDQWFIQLSQLSDAQRKLKPEKVVSRYEAILSDPAKQRIGKATHGLFQEFAAARHQTEAKQNVLLGVYKPTLDLYQLTLHHLTGVNTPQVWRDKAASISEDVRERLEEIQNLDTHMFDSDPKLRARMDKVRDRAYVLLEDFYTQAFEFFRSRAQHEITLFDRNRQNVGALTRAPTALSIAGERLQKAIEIAQARRLASDGKLPHAGWHPYADLVRKLVRTDLHQAQMTGFRTDIDAKKLRKLYQATAKRVARHMEGAARADGIDDAEVKFLMIDQAFIPFGLKNLAIEHLQNIMREARADRDPDLILRADARFLILEKIGERGLKLGTEIDRLVVQIRNMREKVGGGVIWREVIENRIGEIIREAERDGIDVDLLAQYDNRISRVPEERIKDGSIQSMAREDLKEQDRMETLGRANIQAEHVALTQELVMELISGMGFDKTKNAHYLAEQATKDVIIGPGQDPLPGKERRLLITPTHRLFGGMDRIAEGKEYIRVGAREITQPAVLYIAKRIQRLLNALLNVMHTIFAWLGVSGKRVQIVKQYPSLRPVDIVELAERMARVVVYGKRSKRISAPEFKKRYDELITLVKNQQSIELPQAFTLALNEVEENVRDRFKRSQTETLIQNIEHVEKSVRDIYENLMARRMPIDPETLMGSSGISGIRSLAVLARSRVLNRANTRKTDKEVQFIFETGILHLDRKLHGALVPPLMLKRMADGDRHFLKNIGTEKEYFDRLLEAAGLYPRIRTSSFSLQDNPELSNVFRVPVSEADLSIYHEGSLIPIRIELEGRSGPLDYEIESFPIPVPLHSPHFLDVYHLAMSLSDDSDYPSVRGLLVKLDRGFLIRLRAALEPPSHPSVEKIWAGRRPLNAILTVAMGNFSYFARKRNTVELKSLSKQFDDAVTAYTKAFLEMRSTSNESFRRDDGFRWLASLTETASVTRTVHDVLRREISEITQNGDLVRFGDELLQLFGELSLRFSHLEQRVTGTAGDSDVDAIETLRRLQRQARGGNRIKLTAVDEVAPVKGDIDSLELLFMNPLANAIKHSRIDPKTQKPFSVEVDAYIKDGYQVTEITNRGQGIRSLEELRSMFRYGFTRTEGGLGGGLSLTRSLVDQLGGHIEVSSRPGDGFVWNVFFEEETSRAVSYGGYALLDKPYQEGTTIRIRLPLVPPKRLPVERDDRDRKSSADKVEEVYHTEVYPFNVSAEQREILGLSNDVHWSDIAEVHYRSDNTPEKIVFYQEDEMRIPFALLRLRKPPLEIPLTLSRSDPRFPVVAYYVARLYKAFRGSNKSFPRLFYLYAAFHQETINKNMRFRRLFTAFEAETHSSVDDVFVRRRTLADYFTSTIQGLINLYNALHPFSAPETVHLRGKRGKKIRRGAKRGSAEVLRMQQGLEEMINQYREVYAEIRAAAEKERVPSTSELDGWEKTFRNCRNTVTNIVRVLSTPKFKDYNEEIVKEVVGTALEPLELLAGRLDELNNYLIGNAGEQKVDIAALAHDLSKENGKLRDRIEIIAPSNPVWVSGRYYTFKTILRNIIANAIKHTEEKARQDEAEGKDVSEEEKKVRVYIRVRDGRVDIWIQDRGKGMRRGGVFENIFRPGFSWSETTKRKNGTGSGLSIAREHTHLLGGTIAVSTRTGNGAEAVQTVQDADSYPDISRYAIGQGPQEDKPEGLIHYKTETIFRLSFPLAEAPSGENEPPAGGSGFGGEKEPSGNKWRYPNTAKVRSVYLKLRSEMSTTPDVRAMARELDIPVPLARRLSSAAGIDLGETRSPGMYDLSAYAQGWPIEEFAPHEARLTLTSLGYLAAAVGLKKFVGLPESLGKPGDFVTVTISESKSKEDSRSLNVEFRPSLSAMTEPAHARRRVNVLDDGRVSIVHTNGADSLHHVRALKAEALMDYSDFPVWLKAVSPEKIRKRVAVFAEYDEPIQLAWLNMSSSMDDLRRKVNARHQAKTRIAALLNSFGPIPSAATRQLSYEDVNDRITNVFQKHAVPFGAVYWSRLYQKSRQDLLESIPYLQFLHFILRLYGIEDDADQLRLIESNVMAFLSSGNRDYLAMMRRVLDARPQNREIMPLNEYGLLKLVAVYKGVKDGKQRERALMEWAEGQKTRERVNIMSYRYIRALIQIYMDYFEQRKKIQEPKTPTTQNADDIRRRLAELKRKVAHDPLLQPQVAAFMNLLDDIQEERVKTKSKKKPQGINRPGKAAGKIKPLAVQPLFEGVGADRKLARLAKVARIRPHQGQAPLREYEQIEIEAIGDYLASRGQGAHVSYDEILSDRSLRIFLIDSKDSLKRALGILSGQGFLFQYRNGNVMEGGGIVVMDIPLHFSGLIKRQGLHALPIGHRFPRVPVERGASNVMIKDRAMTAAAGFGDTGGVGAELWEDEDIKMLLGQVPPGPMIDVDAGIPYGIAAPGRKDGLGAREYIAIGAMANLPDLQFLTTEVRSVDKQSRWVPMKNNTEMALALRSVEGEPEDDLRVQVRVRDFNMPDVRGKYDRLMALLAIKIHFEKWRLLGRTVEGTDEELRTEIEQFDTPGTWGELAILEIAKRRIAEALTEARDRGVTSIDQFYDIINDRNNFIIPFSLSASKGFGAGPPTTLAEAALSIAQRIKYSGEAAAAKKVDSDLGAILDDFETTTDREMAVWRLAGFMVHHILRTDESLWVKSRDDGNSEAEYLIEEILGLIQSSDWAEPAAIHPFSYAEEVLGFVLLTEFHDDDLPRLYTFHRAIWHASALWGLKMLNEQMRHMRAFWEQLGYPNGFDENYSHQLVDDLYLNRQLELADETIRNREPVAAVTDLYDWLGREIKKGPSEYDEMSRQAALAIFQLILTKPSVATERFNNLALLKQLLRYFDSEDFLALVAPSELAAAHQPFRITRVLGWIKTQPGYDESDLKETVNRLESFYDGPVPSAQHPWRAPPGIQAIERDEAYLAAVRKDIRETTGYRLLDTLQQRSADSTTDFGRNRDAALRALVTEMFERKEEVEDHTVLELGSVLEIMVDGGKQLMVVAEPEQRKTHPQGGIIPVPLVNIFGSRQARLIRSPSHPDILQILEASGLDDEVETYTVLGMNRFVSGSVSKISTGFGGARKINSSDVSLARKLEHVYESSAFADTSVDVDRAATDLRLWRAELDKQTAVEVSTPKVIFTGFESLPENKNVLEKFTSEGGGWAIFYEGMREDGVQAFKRRYNVKGLWEGIEIMPYANARDIPDMFRGADGLVQRYYNRNNRVRHENMLVFLGEKLKDELRHVPNLVTSVYDAPYTAAALKWEIITALAVLGKDHPAVAPFLTNENGYLRLATLEELADRLVHSKAFARAA